MRRWRTTEHENGFSATYAGTERESLVQAIAESDCFEVGYKSCEDSIPRPRLTRVGERYHSWSHPAMGRTRSSIRTRPATQQSSPRRQDADLGGARLWT